MAETIRETVRKRIARQLHCKEVEICDDSPIIEGLGADSLDVVELVTAMEDHYHVQVSDADLLQMKTIDDVVAYLERQAH